MSDPLVPSLLEPSAVEELLRALTKALRAFQMYLPNNPIYHRAQQNTRNAFQPVWEVLDELVLSVVETDFVWDEHVVYHQENKNESLAWTLYKDGMRVLTLRRGCEDAEIVRFLEVVQKARMLPADAGDDLTTLLWEHEFEFIQYRFTEFLSDAVPADFADSLTPGAVPMAPAAVQAQVQEEMQPAAAGQETAGRTGIIDIEDFDSTLYFLDEAEIAYIQRELENEYSQDLRQNSLNVVLDLLELQNEADIRRELLDVLDGLLPNLLNAGEFRTVATLLREFRTVAERAADFAPDQIRRLDDFRGKLSDPVVLTQLLQAVDEAAQPPSPEDLGELFRELRPGALETILVWLPRLRNTSVRDLLVSASERLADASPAEVMRLLQQPESEALGGVIDLCARLQLQGAVPGLGQTLKHDDQQIRLATVMALAEIASAGAFNELEAALEDPDREVRIQAVRALGAKGYRSALKRVEEAVLDRGLKDADLTERIAFFEAYALIAGETGLKPLSAMLIPGGFFRRKERAEIRACAAIALGKIATPEARAVLEQAANDKELVVRNAVHRALRENRP